MTENSTPLPVLLTAAEQDDLRRVLAHVERFDPGGFAHTARHLAALFDDPDRVGEPTYSYCLAGPWGTLKQGDGSLETTIAGCREARADHWADGEPRDERYASIQVMRYAHVSTDLGRFIGAGEVVEVPDYPFTPEEAAENERRLDARAAVRTAVDTRLLAGTGSN